MQEVEQPGQEEEEKTGSEKDEEQKHDREDSKDENPLEKYMKMVLEAREKQHAQVSRTQFSETTVQLCFSNRHVAANL